MQGLDSSFLPWLKQAIPLTQHLGIEALQWQNDDLVMSLTLAPLVNDKGTGFGGGVAGLATLLGWCYVTLVLDEHFERCPVVVKESNNRFLAPITDDFSLHCCCANEQQLDPFLATYAQKGRASLELKVVAYQQASCCFEYQGVYVALGN